MSERREELRFIVAGHGRREDFDRMSEAWKVGVCDPIVDRIMALLTEETRPVAGHEDATPGLSDEKPWLKMTGRERAGFDRTRLEQITGRVHGWCDGCEEHRRLAYSAILTPRGTRAYCAVCAGAPAQREEPSE